MTIILFENGSNRLKFNDSWQISAPSKNREEAVRISNDLIQKSQKGVIIE